MPNVQIGLLPLQYVNNLVISNNATTPNTKLDVTFGQARDSGNINDIILEDGITIDFGVNGANGLDTGSIGASKWYAIYLLGSSTNVVQPACMASLTLTGITSTFPEGYDIYKLIGYWPSDASSHLIPAYSVGNGSLRELFYDTMIKVQNDGTSDTLAAIDLSPAVPAVQNTPVYIQDEFTPATANDYVSYFAGDSTATVGPRTYGSVAAKMNGGQHKVISRIASSVAKIKYINSASSCNVDVWVTGFAYYI